MANRYRGGRGRVEAAEAAHRSWQPLQDSWSQEWNGMDQEWNLNEWKIKWSGMEMKDGGMDWWIWKEWKRGRRDLPGTHLTEG